MGTQLCSRKFVVQRPKHCLFLWVQKPIWGGRMGACGTMMCHDPGFRGGEFLSVASNRIYAYPRIWFFGGVPKILGSFLDPPKSTKKTAPNLAITVLNHEKKDGSGRGVWGVCSDGLVAACMCVRACALFALCACVLGKISVPPFPEKPVPGIILGRRISTKFLRGFTQAIASRQDPGRWSTGKPFC